MTYVVHPETGCWEWQGSRTANGYGQTRSPDGDRKAHRVMYKLFRGPIENTIDHLCRNVGCVNPWHMEDVTIQENIARRPLKTHCPQGHEYTPDNTYQYGSARMCKICTNTRSSARQKEARREARR